MVWEELPQVEECGGGTNFQEYRRIQLSHETAKIGTGQE